MGIGFKLPSGQFIINLAIALAIVFAILRFLPENVKAWFRV
jgi:hypothetical protein